MIYLFIISCDCYSILEAFTIFFIDSIHCCFLVFYPIRIHHNLDLLYHTYNKINKHNERQTLSSILNYFDINF